ncbi:ASKHA domain-containing protein [Chloroflexota bacterium]
MWKTKLKGSEKRAVSRSFLVASPEESYNQKPVYLTQKDVREVQLAKGAIAAGIKTLMDELGIGAKDINHVYPAGVLGNHVDPLSAVRIGLLPRINPGIIRSLGNAASRGASMALLSKKHWQVAKDLVAFIEHIELSYRHDFNKYFVEHLDFPKENMW